MFGSRFRWGGGGGMNAVKIYTYAHIGFVRVGMACAEAVYFGFVWKKAG